MQKMILHKQLIKYKNHGEKRRTYENLEGTWQRRAAEKNNGTAKRNFWMESINKNRRKN